jgi:hypothetical protein
MDIATATPAQIDGKIQELEIELGAVVRQIELATEDVHRAIGQRDTRVNQGTNRRPRYVSEWPTTAEEAIQAARALPSDTLNRNWTARVYEGLETITDVLAKLDGHLLRASELHTALAPLNARYAAEPWSRAWLVTNSGGHVHNTLSCRNCYVTTTYYWVTELSGATDEEVVAQAGAQTCLTCYSSVREDIVAGRPCLIEEPHKKAARIEREKVAAEKARLAALRGITNPDGTPVVIRVHNYPETIKTERTAKVELVNLMWYQKHYSFDDQRAAAIEILEAALAHKNGTTVTQERAEAGKRLTAREKRETRS